MWMAKTTQTLADVHAILKLCAQLLGCCASRRLLQIASAEEQVDRLTASKASAQAEADEADAAAQQALETGHAEVRGGAELTAVAAAAMGAPTPPFVWVVAAARPAPLLAAA